MRRSFTAAVTVTETYKNFLETILGLRYEENFDAPALLLTILDEYQEAKTKKNYDKVDALRAKLKSQGVIVKDMKNLVDWAFEE